MNQQPTLEQLLGLVTGKQQTQNKLDEIAQTQVQNQPMRREGQSMASVMSGRGAPSAQQRGMGQFYSDILNRDKTQQTAIGAAMTGMEKGQALMNDIRTEAKREQMVGEISKLRGQEAHLKSMEGLYDKERQAGLDQDALGKTGTTNFNGQVWQTDHMGRPTRPLGQTESAMNRSDDERVRLRTRQEAADAEAEQDRREAETAGINAHMITNDIASIRDNMNDNTTGAVGGGMSYVWGTDAYDQQTRIDQLKSKLGMDKLAQLRAAAKSGASGLGQLTEKELSRLESALATIEIGQSTKKQKESLDIIERHYGKAIQAYETIFGSGQGGSQSGSTYRWTPDGGVQ